MMGKSLIGKAAAASAAIATAALLASATAPVAKADTMRTLNLSLVCTTGEAYGLEDYTSSGTYTPTSSYVVGDVKYFTVSISASATTLEAQPLGCDMVQPAVPFAGPEYEGYTYNITPGTSTITATGYTNDYLFGFNGYEYLLFYTSLTNITYS